uniref:Cytochrome c oxidase subunit 2 n=1 Tax=Podura aquatica TaxID=50589 RepID=Q6DVG5_9HEXA|nr:cytochrome c oxidase subunit II [Podura aquatica]AAT69334.1 cytochrome c oxidase subunit 2 [Podura aquatica]
MATWSALNFQNAASPIMEELIFFHNHTMTIIILITTIVGYNIYTSVTNKGFEKTIIESEPLELFWTISPTLALMAIGLPSIKILYMMDETYNPMITLKTIAHQWYWSYEYSDFNNLEFDSYMVKKSENMNFYRLIETDNALVLPFNAQIRNLITSSDVLHSWTIPSAGVKADAVPGRLNQVNLNLNRTGVFYGQCSEICGANHSFMPIMLESISPQKFISWIKSMN